MEPGTGIVNYLILMIMETGYSAYTAPTYDFIVLHANFKLFKLKILGML